jgi:tRNA(Ile2) C34 agmatinyltransferase TiaS
MRKGVDVGASVPMEERRDAFSKMGEEMEKAFSVAASEVREAFGTAAENIRGSTGKQTMVCPKCGQKTSSGAIYCYDCGEKIAEK